jgi:Tol biopolymer transport system component
VNISPDGKQFDFVIERGGSTQDLAVEPVAGGAIRTLTSGGGTVWGPVWSPSGSRIAFGSDRAGVGDVFVVDAAGGPVKQLENWPGFEGSPTWTRDDSVLYFLSDRDAKINDLWKVSPEGGEPVRVTRGAIINNITGWRGVDGIFANVFGRRGVLPAFRISANGQMHAVWDKTTSFVQSISPRGDSLILTVDQPNGRTVAMIVSVNGGTARELLPFNEFAGNLSYDGKAALYYYRARGTNHLGVLTLATGAKRPLTHSDDADGGAEWTPDGSKVVFSRFHDVSRIFLVDLTKELAAAK